MNHARISGNFSTIGEWVSKFLGTAVDKDDQRLLYTHEIWNNGVRLARVNYGTLAKDEHRQEAEANASLIALAGNLNQRLDLSKLEAATEKLRNAWPENWALAVDNFLRAITRQPAGEKTTTNE